MDCLGLLAKINMLGALISTNPARTVAVFESYGKTILIRERDFVLPGLQVLRIESRKKVTMRCGGETFVHGFWSLNREPIGADEMDASIGAECESRGCPNLEQPEPEWSPHGFGDEY